MERIEYISPVLEIHTMVAEQSICISSAASFETYEVNNLGWDE